MYIYIYIYTYHAVSLKLDGTLQILYSLALFLSYQNWTIATWLLLKAFTHLCRGYQNSLYIFLIRGENLIGLSVCSKPEFPNTIKTCRESRKAVLVVLLWRVDSICAGRVLQFDFCFSSGNIRKINKDYHLKSSCDKPRYSKNVSRTSFFSSFLFSSSPHR